MDANYLASSPRGHIRVLPVNLLGGICSQQPQTLALKGRGQLKILVGGESLRPLGGEEAHQRCYPKSGA